jgi:nicotinate-nucleotide adenylyltransferase
MKTGILGGTFDPIHMGHLIIAEEVRDRLQLDRIVFIPAKIPPHKLHVKVTSGQHRVKMLELAVRGQSNVTVSDMELQRSGPSYTIDTIKQMQSLGELYLLMGDDSFLAIHTWHRYAELFSLCKIVSVNRPGSKYIEKSMLTPLIQSFFPNKVMDMRSPGSVDKRMTPEDWRICFCPIPGFNISASEIRGRVAQKRTIRYLVPQSVEKYIKTESLYRKIEYRSEGIDANFTHK